MYCSKCGNKLRNGVKFCQKCGNQVVTVIQEQSGSVPDCGVTPAASSPVRHPIRRIVTLVVAAIGAMFIGVIVTCAILSMSGTSVPQENAGDIISESPNAAAQAFVDAIASDGVGTAVALFGCEHRAKSLNFTDYIAKTHLWNPNAVSYPSSTNIFTNANQQYLRNAASDQVSSLVFSLNADERYLDGTMVQNNGEGDLAAEIAEYCVPKNLGTFKILQVDHAMPDIQDTYVSIKNAESLAAIYEGRTIEDCTILYEYNGKTYFGGMQFIQYEDGWYIYSAMTLLGGQNPHGYLTEISKSEYAERVETSDWDTE